TSSGLLKVSPPILTNVPMMAKKRAATSIHRLPGLLMDNRGSFKVRFLSGGAQAVDVARDGNAPYRFPWGAGKDHVHLRPVYTVPGDPVACVRIFPYPRQPFHCKPLDAP